MFHVISTMNQQGYCEGRHSSSFNRTNKKIHGCDWPSTPYFLRNWTRCLRINQMHLTNRDVFSRINFP